MERLCLDTATAAADWQQKHETVLTASEPPLGLDVLGPVGVPHYKGKARLSKPNSPGHSPDDAGSHSFKTGSAICAARKAATVSRLSLSEAAAREADR